MRAILVEDINLYKGIFWIVNMDNVDSNKNYCFKIPCTSDGSSFDIDSEFGIAKSGDTYNHKSTWGKLPCSLTHKKPYNYYQLVPISHLT